MECRCTEEIDIFGKSGGCGKEGGKIEKDKRKVEAPVFIVLGFLI